MDIFKEIDKYFYPTSRQNSIDYLRNIPLMDRDLNELKDDTEFQAEYLKHIYVLQNLVDKEDSKNG